MSFIHSCTSALALNLLYGMQQRSLVKKYCLNIRVHEFRSSTGLTSQVNRNFRLTL